MLKTKAIFLILAAVFFQLSLYSGLVSASPLEDAKKSGYVVELENGYTKAQTSADEVVRALVKDINSRRKAAYARIAKKNGISIDQVAAQSYKQRMSN